MSCASRFVGIVLIGLPILFHYGKGYAPRAGRMRMVKAAEVRCTHIQPALSFGGQRHANHISGVGDRKPGRFCHETRIYLRLNNDFRSSPIPYSINISSARRPWRRENAFVGEQGGFGFNMARRDELKPTVLRNLFWQSESPFFAP